MADGLTSIPTVKEAEELIVEAQELCKGAGLRLHKFNSIKKEVISSVAPTERAVTTDVLGFNPNMTSDGHSLDIQWSVVNDSFGFSISAKEHRPAPLSRCPLGFEAPYTLSGKCRRCVVGALDGMIQFQSPYMHGGRSGRMVSRG